MRLKLQRRYWMGSISKVKPSPLLRYWPNAPWPAIWLSNAKRTITSPSKATSNSYEDIAYWYNAAGGDPDHTTLDGPNHGRIENSWHYIIDWNYDEDRSRIAKGYGPENMTRLRRFAVGLIKSKDIRSVAQKMRELTFNTRLVFDYLKMTENSQRRACVQKGSDRAGVCWS